MRRVEEGETSLPAYVIEVETEVCRVGAELEWEGFASLKVAVDGSLEAAQAGYRHPQRVEETLRHARELANVVFELASQGFDVGNDPLVRCMVQHNFGAAEAQSYLKKYFWNARPRRAARRKTLF